MSFGGFGGFGSNNQQQSTGGFGGFGANNNTTSSGTFNLDHDGPLRQLLTANI